MRARRIRTFREGTHTPSPPPAVLSQLTDELLVIASDVTAAVGAEGKALSGNSIFRLLAWTVADARGATAALEKPLALTIGRRLDSRAETVRDELAAAAAAVEECRVDLSNEERSTRREGELREYAAMFAEAKAEQQRVKKHARDEVYIGFHELESLLPRAEVATVAQPRFPFPGVQELPHRPLPPMPPDLTAALDTAVCAELQGRFAGANAWDYNDDPEAHVWWTQLLPDFVAELRAQRDAARAERDKARDVARAVGVEALRQREAAHAREHSQLAERHAAELSAHDRAHAMDQALAAEKRLK